MGTQDTQHFEWDDLMTHRSAARAAALGQRMDRKNLNLFAFTFVFAAIWMLSLAPAFAQNFQFSRVDVEGNKRIESSTIVSYAQVPTGQTVSAATLNEGYQTLLSTGLFETVDMIPRGGRLVIQVQEYPTINRVAFEGNRRIKDEDLAPLIRSQSRRVFNPTQVEQDRQAITDAYADVGRMAARVSPKIIRQSDNRVDLIFEVFEGGIFEVNRIGVVGNRAFSDRRLRRVLNTKQTGFLRALVRRDTFIEDQIAFDQQVLRDFYQSRGYVDFRVNNVSAELTEEQDGYFVTFNVREGQQFKIGAISVTSDLSSVDIDKFTKKLRIKTGQTYSPDRISREITRLEALAQQEGLDFIRVTPDIGRNDADLTLDVNFVVERGPRIFVERINVEGNTATLDQVIRRQFRTVEGDPFNPRDIRQAAERIRALGFFENADVNAQEGSTEDQVIVNVDVVEAPTGSFTFGGTYSPDDGFGGILEYGERNFLGRGQALTLSLQGGADNQNYSFKFTEPAFLHNDLSFSLGASYLTTDNKNAAYDTTIWNIQPSISFPVSDNTILGLRYTAQNSEITGVNTQGDVIASEAALGDVMSHSVGYTVSYDTRRTGFDPNTGFLLRLDQDFGLGGDSRYVKTVGKALGQTRILNEEVTLRATVEGGMLNYSEGQSRVTDRFAMNANIIRGFQAGGFGPRERSDGVNDALGGEMYAAARLEAEFPLGIPEEYGIYGGLFYDVGNLWSLQSSEDNILYENGSWRHVVGASLFWRTPIGPLRFNFSEVLRKEDFDRAQSFQLTISTSF